MDDGDPVRGTLRRGRVVIPATTKCAASVAIKFDDGDSMVAELRLRGRSGWIRDQDGNAHHIRVLGGSRRARSW